MAPFRIFIVGDWEGGVPTACILTTWTSSFQLRDSVSPCHYMALRAPLVWIYDRI